MCIMCIFSVWDPSTESPCNRRRFTATAAVSAAAITVVAAADVSPTAARVFLVLLLLMSLPTAAERLFGGVCL